MKITLVSHANSKIDQIESLKRQFDIHVFRPGDSLSFYDLVIFDANQAENILCTETALPWMVINEKSIHHTLKYFQAGACAVLDQLYPVENFSRCLKKISSGHLYIEPEIMQILAMRQIHKQLTPFSSLSSREFDVFCMLAENCSLSTIASSLGVSKKTVSNCQAQIKQKLGLADGHAIKRYAEKHGLI